MFLVQKDGDGTIPALNLTARVSPVFSWSAFLGGTNVTNTEASLASFIPAKCHSPQVDCVWPSINFTNSVLRYPNSQTVHTDENQLVTQSLSLLLEFSQMIFFLKTTSKMSKGNILKSCINLKHTRPCINSDLTPGERNTGHLIIPWFRNQQP